MDERVQGWCVFLLFRVFSPAEALRRTNVLSLKGGKAYGLLKAQQEEKLNSINEVKTDRKIIVPVKYV